MREEEGFETPTWEALLECFEAPKWAAPPLVLARTCKKQQANACWKCCKTLENTQKFLLVKT
jgi:hypothetical protein